MQPFSTNNHFCTQQNVTRKLSIDSDTDDKLVDDRNIEDLIKELPQASDKTAVECLDNMLALLPNK